MLGLAGLAVLIACFVCCCVCVLVARGRSSSGLDVSRDKMQDNLVGSMPRECHQAPMPPVEMTASTTYPPRPPGGLYSQRDYRDNDDTSSTVSAGRRSVGSESELVHDRLLPF